METQNKNAAVVRGSLLTQQSSIFKHPTSSSALPTAYCPASKFSLQPYGAHCYEFVDTSVTWRDADLACHVLNGTLAFVETPAQLEFLEWWLNELGVYGYVWVHDISFINGEQRVGFIYRDIVWI